MKKQQEQKKPNELVSRGFSSLLKLKSMMRSKPKQVEFLLPELGIESGTVTLLCGLGGNGKSWLAYHLALCVASGRKVTDWSDAPKPGKRPVLMLDYEMGKDSFHRRITRLHTGANLAGKPFGNPDDLWLDYLYTSGALNDPDALEALKTGILDNDYKLVVIDNLRRIHDCDENDTRAGQVLTDLRRIANETKCAFLILHHMGKGKSGKGTAGRGTSDFQTNVTSSLVIEPRSDDTFILRQDKTNDFRVDTFEFKLVDHGERDALYGYDRGLPKTVGIDVVLSPTVKMSEAKPDYKHKVIAYVSANPPCKSQRELISKVGGNVKAVNDAIKQLLDSGSLRKTDDGIVLSEIAEAAE